MKKRMMLIINPMAGRSGYKTGFGEVMNILDSGGYLTTVYFTQGRGDATVMAAQHAAEYDTVACIGGDGTLSEVVSGLMQVPNPPPLGYIPMGTTNDVASTLGLPKNATDAALRIVTGTPTAFDVGSFGERSYFTYVAAFGAFTAVSYETPQNEKQALARESAAPNAERTEILRADYVRSADIKREIQRVYIAVVRAHSNLPEPAALGVLKLIEILFGERAHCRNAC